MTLYVEVFNRTGKQWVVVGQINPGDPGGSLSNHATGVRELYHFESITPERSALYRANLSVDTLVTPMLRLTSMDTSQLEVIADLGPGDTYELVVKTDVSPYSRQMRFRQSLATDE